MGRHRDNRQVLTVEPRSWARMAARSPSNPSISGICTSINDNIEVLSLDGGEGLASVASYCDVVSLFLQEAASDLLVDRIILRQENV